MAKRTRKNKRELLAAIREARDRISTVYPESTRDAIAIQEAIETLNAALEGES